MIFIVIVALVVMVYFFGLKSLCVTGGLFALFYVYAIISARRSPEKKEQKNDQHAYVTTSSPSE